MPFAQDTKTKNFLSEANSLIDKGIEGSYKAIAEKLGWADNAFFLVRKGQRNVPADIYKKFKETYNITTHHEPQKAPASEAPGLKEELISLLKDQVGLLKEQNQLLRSQLKGEAHWKEKTDLLAKRLDELLHNQLASEALSQAYQEYAIEALHQGQGKKVNGKHILAEIRRKAVEKLVTFSESGIEVS